jgi:hypothetical protein
MAWPVEPYYRALESKVRCFDIADGPASAGFSFLTKANVGSDSPLSSILSLLFGLTSCIKNSKDALNVVLVWNLIKMILFGGGFY